MSFASGENILFMIAVIAGYIFSIIDSLFFGYYVWLYFGPQFFLLYFFSSVPFVFINRANNYAQIYAYTKEALNNIQDSPWVMFAQMLCLLILGYFTYNLYIVYYGSWVIQILKLLRNKMGFSGMEWIRILVFIALIPESLSFCFGLFNNLKGLVISLYQNMKSMSVNMLFKSLPYLILAAIAIVGAIISAQISASYIMLTYQHYLMEFYEISVPVVKNKIIILGMLFADMFFTIKQFFESVCKTYQEKDLARVKHNYFSYMVLCFTMYMRAVSKIFLAVGIATSPWHVNIKVSTFLQSMFDDILSIKGSNTVYAKAIMRIAILLSLLNLCFYIGLIYYGHIQVSLTYMIMSVLIASVLSIITPVAMYNTNNSSEIVEGDVCYTVSNDLINNYYSFNPEIESKIAAAIETCQKYTGWLSYVR